MSKVSRFAIVTVINTAICVSAHAEQTASPDSLSAGDNIDVVIVTAQKRSERLQDVPVPVTAISAESLVATNQLRLQDYYAKVPGLGLVLQSAGSSTVVMRGLATGGQTGSTVGMVIDDVPYGGTINPGTTATVPDVDPGDLARVEALRGPQGTLYGASSLGGLLKYVTIEPSTERFGSSLQTGIGSVEDGEVGYNVRAAVNVPLSDIFAVRVSGFKARDPGYVDNTRNGARDINRLDKAGGRIAALLKPSDNLSINLSAVIQESKRRGTDEVDTTLGGALAQSALPGSGLYDRDSQAYIATIAGKAGKVDVTSITGYTVDKQDSTQEIFSATVVNAARTNFGVTGAPSPVPREYKKFSQEIRASMPLGERFDWLLGGFYTAETGDFHFEYEAANQNTGAVVGKLLIADQPTSYDEYAAFTNLTATITDQFDIQFGGRYSKNKQSFASVRSGILQPVFYPGAAIQPEIRSEDDSFTYLVTPRFKVSPDLMIYARMASGYRPGGPNANCGGVVPCQYSADKTQNYEIGIKGDIASGVLSFDASVFYIDWKDVQIALRDPVQNVTYNANAGSAKSQGVELALELRPLSGLTISASGAWNEAELTKNFPATAVGAVGRPGDPLPYGSRFTGSLSVDEEFPLADSIEGFVGASLNSIGDRKGIFRPANVARQEYPSYTQVAVRAGARYGTWSLTMYSTNVTDRRGVLNGGLDGSRPIYFTYITPRVIGMNLSKTF